MSYFYHIHYIFMKKFNIFLIFCHILSYLVKFKKKKKNPKTLTKGATTDNSKTGWYNFIVYKKL